MSTGAGGLFNDEALDSPEQPDGDVQEVAHDILDQHAREVRESLEEQLVIGDGNCMFRAIAIQTQAGTKLFSCLRNFPPTPQILRSRV